jgi:hypothetical protein
MPILQVTIVQGLVVSSDVAPSHVKLYIDIASGAAFGA